MTAFLASQFVGLPVFINDFSVFESRKHDGGPSEIKKPASTSARSTPSVEQNTKQDPEWRGLLSLPTPERKPIEPWSIYFRFPIVLERKEVDESRNYRSHGNLEEQD
ncbi:hypothetical protein BC567DRAFT_292007 [Phyllosticta citribraziliensis]